MNDPFQAIQDDGPVGGVLNEAACASEEELSKAAEELTGDDLESIGDWVLSKLLAIGVHYTLVIGGLLYIYRAATNRAEHRRYLLDLIEKAGISETKAYVSEAIFRVFGKVLLAEQWLMKLFPVESLRRLAALDAPVAAREEAIRLARSGKRITIALATELIEQHRVPESPSGATQEHEKQPAAKTDRPPTKSPKASAARQIWHFTGDVVRLTLESDAADALPPISVLKDLEAAVEHFRRELEDDDQSDAA